MKRKYWTNVMAMLGVAMAATAFFAKGGESLFGGLIGIYCLWQGSKWSN